MDEVTQYEFVGAAEAISERFLIPVLEGLLGLFPFCHQRLPRRQRVAQRRAGSEYVNHRVAALLEKLRAEFTRSPPALQRQRTGGEQERQRRAPAPPVLGRLGGQDAASSGVDHPLPTAPVRLGT